MSLSHRVKLFALRLFVVCALGAPLLFSSNPVSAEGGGSTGPIPLDSVSRCDSCPPAL